jgi:hypothetical protein
VARQDEEDVDTDEPSVEARQAHVEGHHHDDGDRPEPVDVGSIAHRARTLDGPPRPGTPWRSSVSRPRRADVRSSTFRPIASVDQGFRADIEGLRGVAVLAVVLFHSGYDRFAGSYVSVDVFFVISGYLITQNLTREAERSGRIALRKFWSHRVKRLAPALAVARLVGLMLKSPPARHQLARSVAGSCQRSSGSARWRTVELPSRGQQNCPVVASSSAR